jgi:hypothetical protein
MKTKSEPLPVPVVVADLSPVAVEPPRLKAGGVIVAGAVAVVLEPVGLKALPPRRVLDGAGDDAEVSLGLGARPENMLLPILSGQTSTCPVSSEYVTCCSRACSGACRCRRRGKD